MKGVNKFCVTCVRNSDTFRSPASRVANACAPWQPLNRERCLWNPSPWKFILSPSPIACSSARPQMRLKLKCRSQWKMPRAGSIARLQRRAFPVPLARGFHGARRCGRRIGGRLWLKQFAECRVAPAGIPFFTNQLLQEHREVLAVIKVPHERVRFAMDGSQHVDRCSYFFAHALIRPQRSHHHKTICDRSYDFPCARHTSYGKRPTSYDYTEETKENQNDRLHQHIVDGSRKQDGFTGAPEILSVA